VACATAVSVALNVANAPERLAAQLFAALPPVALLGALELLMSVARCGLPHTDRTTRPAPSRPRRPQPHPSGRPAAVALRHRSPKRHGRTLWPHPAAVAALRPQPAPQGRSAATAGNGSAPARDSRARVRELVARERASGRRLAAREVAAAAGISERRAYELLRALRAE
jgi:hypothetical protein